MYLGDIWMYQFLKKDWASVFPNIEIVLQIALSQYDVWQLHWGKIVLKFKSNQGPFKNYDER